MATICAKCRRNLVGADSGMIAFHDRHFDGDEYRGPIYCSPCGEQINRDRRQHHAPWCDCESCQLQV